MNRARGYRLHSWELSRLATVDSVLGVVLNETVLAVFELEAPSYTASQVLEALRPMAFRDDVLAMVVARLERIAERDRKDPAPSAVGGVVPHP